MQYRPEIDGLRAVAVIPVILFHAGINLFSGGFVGVDVFFVISGYLITTIILSEMESNRFSIINFYERRARRILPALFFVMFVSFIVAWFLLPSIDMRSFSQSLVAVSVFSSNVLFWLTSGYWDTASELKPLLHTWSLAVEEQYYLLFPVFLLLMWKQKRRWIITTFLAAAGLSLIAAQWASYRFPSASFYLLPTRFWELAVGGCIAFYIVYRRHNKKTTANASVFAEISGLAGILLIGYSVFSYNETVPFPSLYTLVPTIGTALIILFATANTHAARLLSCKPLVFIGLISYSAYLWHQPLLAFARHGLKHEPSTPVLAAIACLAFPLAFLSWKFVEGPFRNRNRINRKNVFLFSVIGSILFIAVGLGGQITNGYEIRHSDEERHLLNFRHYNVKEAYRQRSCFLDLDQRFTDFDDKCIANTTDPTANKVVLWGDSHSAALSYGLHINIENLTQMTASGCTPIIDYSPITRPNCGEINQFALAKIEQIKPAILLMHANWSYPMEEISGGLKQGLQLTIDQVQMLSPKTRVVLLGGVPQWAPSLPVHLVKNGISLRDTAYNPPYKYREITSTDNLLATIAQKQNVEFISILDLVCIEGSCLTAVETEDGYEPTAWDYGHLTKPASSLVAKKLLPLLPKTP